LPASSGGISRSPGAAVQEDISNILPEMKAWFGFCLGSWSFYVAGE
jgi:hypothetical protein